MKCLLLAMASCLLCQQSSAQIISYFLQHEINYSQTSDNNAMATQFYFSAGLSTKGENDAASVTLSVPGSTKPINLEENPFAQWALPTSGGIFSYASETDLYANDPNGTYSFKTAGGTFGAQTDTVNSTSTNQAPVVLTGTSLENLAFEDPTSPITVTFHPVVFSPLASGNLNFVVFTANGFNFVNSFFPSNNSNSFTFPSDTFTAGQSYDLWLIDTETFSSAEDVYSDLNIVDFTAGQQEVPEPAGPALLAVGLAAIFCSRMSRRTS